MIELFSEIGWSQARSGTFGGRLPDAWRFELVSQLYWRHPSNRIGESATGGSNLHDWGSHLVGPSLADFYILLSFYFYRIKPPIAGYVRPDFKIVFRPLKCNLDKKASDDFL